jgi:hypothetical protein
MMMRLFNETRFTIGTHRDSLLPKSLSTLMFLQTNSSLVKSSI